jgi:predicted branched-subunit amino acid permease
MVLVTQLLNPQIELLNNVLEKLLLVFAIPRQQVDVKEERVIVDLAVVLALLLAVVLALLLAVVLALLLAVLLAALQRPRRGGSM